MNIEITGDLPEFSLSRDPKLVAVRLSDFYTGATRERWRIRFVEEPAVADKIAFNISGVDQELTCVAIGDPLDGHTFWVRDTMSLNDWLVQFVQQILLNVELAEHYDVYRVNGNTIEVTAKEPGTAWELSLSAVGWAPQFTEMQDAADLTMATNYQLRLRVRMNGAQDEVWHREGPWMSFTPVIDGTGQFDLEVDISDMVDAMFEAVDLVEEYGTSVSNSYLSHRRYYLEAAAFNQDEGTTEAIQAGLIQHVMKGGRMTWDQSEEFLSAIVDEKRWLTNRRGKVFTHRSVYDWLTFVAPKDLPGGQTFQVRAIIWNKSQTNVMHQVLSTSTMPKYRSVRVPCGFDQLGLGALGGVTEPYKVVFTAGYYSAGLLDELACEEITFYLMPDTTVHGWLQYINSFGVMESLYLQGAQELEVKHDKEIMRVERPLVLDHTNPIQYPYGTRSQHALEVTTAPMSDEEWRAALDILVSTQVFYVNPENSLTRRVPCVVDPGSVKNESRNWMGNTYQALRFRLVFDEQVDNSIQNPIY